MRFAVVFAIASVGFAFLAVHNGGWQWVLLWPAVSYAVVAAMYAGVGPGPIGKRADGTIGWPSIVVLLPYFLYVWTVWAITRAVTREPAANEVTPGVWVGRRPTESDLPAGVTIVVDLAAEFPAGRAVRRRVAYLSVPTLDGTATDAAPMAAAVAAVESTAGAAYIGCAFGHGRSAAVAAAVLVRRGLAADVAAAEAMMRARRPRIHLKLSQAARAAEVAASV